MAFCYNIVKNNLLHKYVTNCSNLLVHRRIDVGQIALYGKKAKDTKSKGKPPRRDPLDTTFTKYVDAFKSKTTGELYRAYFVYTMCSFDYIVDNNLAIMKRMEKVLGGRIFNVLMKHTFYGHFVAGEDEEKIMPCLNRLRSFGVKPILDYSVEEDISQEEAEQREVASSVSEAATKKSKTDMNQYSVNKNFADRRYKVQSARVYFYLNEAQCEKNMEIFIKCLEAVAIYDTNSEKLNKNYSRSTAFGSGIMAVKLTALGRPQLLLQLSEVIAKTRKYISEIDGGTGNILGRHMKTEDLEKKLDQPHIDKEGAKKLMKNCTTDKEGILHLFPWAGVLNENFQLNETFKVPDLKTGKMLSLITELTAKEEEMFRNMIRRLKTVCKAAIEMDVRVMVDAEQTYFQPAISRITMEMMRNYNKDKVIVFNTYQNYLLTTFDEVQTDMEQAKRQDFHFGAKLVRGAYLEQERARSEEMGYPDPTNPDYEATSAMYFKTLSECLFRIKEQKEAGQSPKIGILVASHSEDTVRFALAKMKDVGVSPEDKVICFGQLLGMCDYITFPLGQAGYSVYKYIPYGPVKEVLPYLSRRANENKGVLLKIKKEKRLLLKEMARRLVTLKFFYKPQGNYTPV